MLCAAFPVDSRIIDGDTKNISVLISVGNSWSKGYGIGFNLHLNCKVQFRETNKNRIRRVLDFFITYPPDCAVPGDSNSSELIEVKVDL